MPTGHPNLAGLVALLALAGGAQEARGAETPRLLVIQNLAQSNGGFENNLMVAAGIAETLDQEGRVLPIAWTPTDPLLKEALEALRQSYVPVPTANLREAVRRQLNAPYVLEVEAVRSDGQVSVGARLTRNGREIWRFLSVPEFDGPGIKVIRNGRLDREATRELQQKYANQPGAQSFFVALVNGLPDWQSTAASIERTLALIIGSDPLRDLPARPRIDSTLDPVFLQPQYKLVPDATGDWQENVKDALAANETENAITILRDAVDREPSDIATRLWLAKVLAEGGQAALGATEAARAARMSGRDPSLWALACRMALDAQQIPAAREYLHQATARGLEGADLHRLRADIALYDGDLDAAISAMNDITDEGSILTRGLVLALRGAPAELVAPSMQNYKGDEATTLDRYTFAIHVMERQMPVWVMRLREAPVRVRQGMTATERRDLIRTGQELDGIVAYLRAAPVPARHRISHEGRLLAMILLAKSAQESLAFADTLDRSLGDDAAMSLGEGLRLMNSVRENFAVERGERWQPTP